MTEEETQQPDPGDGTLDGEPLADVPDAGGEGELGDEGAGPAESEGGEN